MQEDRTEINNSVIVFRRWVDLGRKMQPEAFKSVFLAFFDYMLDNVPPTLVDPCEKIIIDFFVDDYDRYKEYKRKIAARQKAWREKKEKEEKEKRDMMLRDVTRRDMTGHDVTECDKTTTVTVTDTVTVTPTVTPVIDSVSSQLETAKNKYTLIPCMCVSKDAGAREGAQDTHTQEVPEGVQLTAEQLEDVKKRYPSDWREVLSKFAAQLAKGYKVADHYSTLIKWTEEDKKRQRGTSGNRGSTTKAESRGSFDTDDFFEAALHRSYDDM